MKLCLVSLFMWMALFLSAGDAPAAQRGLFLLGNFSQSLSFSYSFANQDSTSPGGREATSTFSRFDEGYRAKLGYALLSPRIYNGHISAGVKLDQETFSTHEGSSRTSGLGYTYSLDGVFFDTKPYPFSYVISSDTYHAELPFSSGYDVSIDTYSAAFQIRNKYLPMQTFYTKTISETTGLSINNRLTTDTISLWGTHRYGRSDTQFTSAWTENHSESLSSSGVAPASNAQMELQFTNRLDLSNGRSLYTSGTFLDEKNSDAMNRNLSINEAITWPLGKALTLGADYNSGYARFINIPRAQSTETVSNAGSVSLSHHLFQSLQSRLSLRGRQETQSEGKVTYYAGFASLSYNKSLPRDSNLQLSYNEAYSVIDRNLASNVLTAVDEKLAAQVFGKNLLANPEVIVTSIIVRDANNPVISYSEGKDYRIIQQGNLTGFDFSLLGSLITEGKQLLVTYDFRVNRSIAYASHTRGLDGTLFLDKGTYQLSAGFNQSNQDLLRGQADTLGLSDSKQYSVSAIWNYMQYYANLSYYRNDSTQSRDQYFEGLFRSQHYYGDNTIILLGRDRYSMYGATATNKASHSDNTVSINASLLRNLRKYGLLQFNAGYVHFSAADFDKDEVNLESIYRWSRGKLSLEVSAKERWRFSPFQDLREDRFYIRIVRYF